MGEPLISRETVAELYAYLQNHGGSYAELEIRFRASGISPHTDSEYGSRRKKDMFLDKYIQPLNLSEESDAQKLFRFIRQVIRSADGSVDPEAGKLVLALRDDGWDVTSSGDIPRPLRHMPRPAGWATAGSADLKRLLDTLIEGLPDAMYPLRTRRGDLPCLEFDNEYDVQDLLECLLRPWVEDVRREEYTPSYAGSSTRMDILLPSHEAVVELKYVRDHTHAKGIGEELISDIHHYGRHPQCKRLWIVIYDPNRYIANPSGMMSDLTGDKEGIRVQTRIIS